MREKWRRIFKKISAVAARAGAHFAPRPCPKCFMVTVWSPTPCNLCAYKDRSHISYPLKPS